MGIATATWRHKRPCRTSEDAEADPKSKEAVHKLRKSAFTNPTAARAPDNHFEPRCRFDFTSQPTGVIHVMTRRAAKPARQEKEPRCPHLQSTPTTTSLPTPARRKP